MNCTWKYVCAGMHIMNAGMPEEGIVCVYVWGGLSIILCFFEAGSLTELGDLVFRLDW